MQSTDFQNMKDMLRWLVFLFLRGKFLKNMDYMMNL